MGVLKTGQKDVVESMRLCHCSQARTSGPRKTSLLYFWARDLGALENSDRYTCISSRQLVNLCAYEITGI